MYASLRCIMLQSGLCLCYDVGCHTLSSCVMFCCVMPCIAHCLRRSLGKRWPTSPRQPKLPVARPQGTFAKGIPFAGTGRSQRKPEDTENRTQFKEHWAIGGPAAGLSGFSASYALDSVALYAFGQDLEVGEEQHASNSEQNQKWLCLQMSPLVHIVLPALEASGPRSFGCAW